MRIFAGISIPAHIGEQFRPVVDALREQDVRTTLPQDLHLTLKFFGDLSEDEVREIRAQLRSVSHAALHITVDGIGGFPDLAEPRIIFAKVEETPELMQLAQKIDALTQQVPRDKPFRAHITLARPQIGVNVPQQELKDAFLATSFTLYATQPSEDGHYKVLERYLLLSST